MFVHNSSSTDVTFCSRFSTPTRRSHSSPCSTATSGSYRTIVERRRQRTLRAIGSHSPRWPSYRRPQQSAALPSRSTSGGCPQPVTRSCSSKMCPHLGPDRTADYTFSNNGLMVYPRPAADWSNLAWMRRKRSSRTIPRTSRGRARCRPTTILAASGLWSPSEIVA